MSSFILFRKESESNFGHRLRGRKHDGRIPIYLILILLLFSPWKLKLLRHEGCHAENKWVFVIIRISPHAKKHTDPATKGFKFQNCSGYTELSQLYSKNWDILSGIRIVDQLVHVGYWFDSSMSGNTWHISLDFFFFFFVFSFFAKMSQYLYWTHLGTQSRTNKWNGLDWTVTRLQTFTVALRFYSPDFLS